MSKPPEPSARTRACSFTSTSSPTSTSPVSRGYATQAMPSTSSRTRPGTCSSTAETTPRLRLIGILGGVDQGERDVDHRVEVGDGDVLVGCVDLPHPVREVEARDPAGVEDVRVGAAAGQGRHELVAAALERCPRQL